MDIVFRFAALVTAIGHADGVALSTHSDFQHRLAQAADRDAVLRAAREFVDTGFVRGAEQVADGPLLVALLAAGTDPETTARAVREAVGDTDVGHDAERVKDTVVAAYILPDAPSAADAQQLVRAYALLHTDDPAATLRAPLALPDFVVGLRETPVVRPEPDPWHEARELAGRINDLAARRDAVADAITAVTAHAEDELVLSEGGRRTILDDLYRQVGRAEPAPRQDEKQPTEAGERGANSPLLRAALGRNVTLSGTAVELLGDRATHTLRDLNLDPAVSTIADINRRLTDEHGQLGQQLRELAGGFAKLKLPAEVDDARPRIPPSWLLQPVDEPDGPPPVSTAPPTTHTQVRPLGVADLVVVRSGLDHYERAEVTAIENVLPHDVLTHRRRALDTTERTGTNESEDTDLRTAAKTTADQDHRTLASGPGMGPVAAAPAHDFAQTVTDAVSTSLSNRTRQVTTDRLLREREDITEHVVTGGESVVHGVYQRLDAVHSAQAFRRGRRLLYDLVVPDPSAVFRAALSRSRSGLPLPTRPARFTVAPTDLDIDNWAYYAAGHHASGVDAPPPTYTTVAESFGNRAKDPFAVDSTTNSVIFAEARTTRIPKGYRAVSWMADVNAESYPAGRMGISIGDKRVLGSNPVNMAIFHGKLTGETDNLHVAVHVDSDGVNWGVSTFSVGVEILCEATPELVSAWQVRTHAQILDAYERRARDYEQAVATRDAIARLYLQNMAADRKAATVRTELQRTVLEVLTGQNFSGFNALRLDGQGFPYADPAASTGLAAYIRFFQQAVEWDQLAYACYPYFWGGQQGWAAKILGDEPDPAFAAFLDAGAARVVLPIRPGHEAAFERFLATGNVPTTDEQLDVGGPLWVSLVDELRRGAGDVETPLGEPWQFRLATDLVWARPDGSVPRWPGDVPDPGF
ncbi:hypothetical protein [Actinokineospora enzanensis]|uniref:hypothetical protein n=1 Tax=Actinokineospora enzanensis TaxID=155975 RepID=UPI00036E7785|nr:hypothetical protein [Actinokineospora enzanensis]